MRIPRRVRRHIEASLMCRQPWRTARGRSRQIGKAAPQHWKNWETFCRDQFPKNFPNPPEAVPNLLRRGDATRHRCGRMGLAPMRPHQGPMVRGSASAQQFPKSGAVAPYQGSNFPCACAEAGKEMLPMWKCYQCQNPTPNSSGDIDNWLLVLAVSTFPHFHNNLPVPFSVPLPCSGAVAP